MKKLFTKFFASLIIALTLGQSAFAELSFEITNQEAPKTKILFFGFNPSDPNLKTDAFQILLNVQRNLNSTNLFEIIQDHSTLQVNEPGASQNNIVNSQLNANKSQNFGDNKNLENLGELNPSKTPIYSVESLPDFKKYNAAQVGAIIVAQLNYDIEGNLEIRLRLWDVLDQRQLFGKFYSSSKDNYKKLSNLISDEIFKALTGEKAGHFNSRILYVSQSGSIRKRIKKIAMIDFDGANRRVLTDGRDLVLTPIFAKNPHEIYYLSYRENRPQIYSMNLHDNLSKRIGGFYATTFAANANPQDQNKILLSAIFDGNSDVFEMHIKENRATRLTKSPSIDTTAAYSPDAKTIAFISDRDNSQQIYLMDANGSNIRKASKGVGTYAKPVWSPDGTMLAFTRVKAGQFYIGTMSTNGTNERLLASGYMVEGARWSPNGRYLLYSKTKSAYGKGSVPRLYTMDIATGFEYELPLPEGEGATDPDWIAVN